MPYRVQDDSVTVKSEGNSQYSGNSITIRGEERGARNRSRRDAATSVRSAPRKETPGDPALAT